MLFDRKFGREFIHTIPMEAGVYSFLDEHRSVLYVGKAKNLRRRLRQYRLARGGKMRKIVKRAAFLEWTGCTNDLDACLLELKQIQSLRPKLNIAGAFSHRYPMIGFRTKGSDSYLCFTTTPEVFPLYRFYGAYRSRQVTADAFFGLLRLLQFVGHRTKSSEEKKAYSYEFGFRRLPAVFDGQLDAFFRGIHSEFLGELVLRLLENAGARAKAEEVQESIDSLQEFWKHECVPLASAIAAVGFETYPVPQSERDPLFIRAGYKEQV